MARARNLKPGFFKNHKLYKTGPLGRLLFAGLWTIADREGRLEDVPEQIKVETLPYDRCNVDELLTKLHESEFILRYESGGHRFIQIRTWKKHQNPHVKESASTIPAPVLHQTGTGNSGASPADSLFLDSLSSDSLNRNPDSGVTRARAGEKQGAPVERVEGPRKFAGVGVDDDTLRTQVEAPRDGMGLDRSRSGSEPERQQFTSASEERQLFEPGQTSAVGSGVTVREAVNPVGHRPIGAAFPAPNAAHESEVMRNATRDGLRLPEMQDTTPSRESASGRGSSADRINPRNETTESGSMATAARPRAGSTARSAAYPFPPLTDFDPEAHFRRIWDRHFRNRSRIEHCRTAFLEILSQAEDPEAMARKVDRNHEAWVAHWRETNSHPLGLLNWLQGGDWHEPPPREAQAESAGPKEWFPPADWKREPE